MLNRNTAIFTNNVNSFIRIKPSLDTNDKSSSKLSKKLINSSDDYFHKSQFELLKVIGQFDKKFIITMNLKDNNIILFDQHAIHERILYELYSKLLLTEIEHQILNKNFISENKYIFKNVFSKFTLKKPITLKIKLDKAMNFLQDSYSLFNFYFKINSFEHDNLIITLISVPIILDRILDEETLVNEMMEKLFRYRLINEVIDGKKIQFYLKDIFLDVIKSKACRNALKFNDIISFEKMKSLIINLKNCKNPFICAHGRHNFYIIKKL